MSEKKQTKKENLQLCRKVKMRKTRVNKETQ